MIISRSNLLNQVRFWFHHHSHANVDKSAREFFEMLEFRTEIEFLTTSPRQLNQNILTFLFHAAKFHLYKNRFTFNALFDLPLPLDEFAEDHFAANLIAIRILKDALEWATEHLLKKKR